MTFICCLCWKLEYGIIVGAAIQCFFILYSSARPNIRIETYKVNRFSFINFCQPKKLVRNHHTQHYFLFSKDSSNIDYIWITPDRSLIYSSINYVRNVISSEISQTKDPYSAAVIDCSQITSIDFTTAKGFKAIIDEFKHHKKAVLFYNPNALCTHTLVGALSNDIVIINSLENLEQYIDCS